MEQEAVSTPQQPTDAPVTGNADVQAAPSVDAKPELFDLSPLGETWKDMKVSKAIADKLPSLLRSEHFTPELVDHLSDPVNANLFFQSEKGYRQAHAERFEKEAKAIKAADDRMKSLAEKEDAIARRERELAEIEGDNFFYRDEKVKRVAREAAKEAEELGLDGERAQAYVDKITKPYADLAKAEHQRKSEEHKKQVEAILEGNSRIAAEVFPELDPSLSRQLLDGFVVNGVDPKQASDLLRKELDRVISAREARAVAEYVRKVNINQPDTPPPTAAKPIPSTSAPNEYAESVARGRSLFGSVFGK